MVALNRHVGTLAATTPDERTELMQLTRRAEIALTEAYTPQGINIGVNIGSGRPAPASSIICTCIWCRAGTATPIS